MSHDDAGLQEQNTSIVFTISVCSLPKEMNQLSDHRKRSDNHNKGGEMPMYTCMLVMQTKINMITDKDIC